MRNRTPTIAEINARKLNMRHGEDGIFAPVIMLDTTTQRVSIEAARQICRSNARRWFADNPDETEYNGQYDSPEVRRALEENRSRGTAKDRLTKFTDKKSKGRGSY